MTGVALSSDQARCLWDVATHIDPATDRINWTIVGIADLAEPEAALGLAEAMQAGDWLAASKNCALAGRNNLLVGILIQLSRVDQCAWAVLRFPSEPWESASLEAWGRASKGFPPNLSWNQMTQEDAGKGIRQ